MRSWRQCDVIAVSRFTCFFFPVSLSPVTTCWFLTSKTGSFLFFLPTSHDFCCARKLFSSNSSYITLILIISRCVKNKSWDLSILVWEVGAWWIMCTSQFAAHATLLSVQKSPEATRVQLLVLVTLSLCEVWGRQQLNTYTRRPQTFKTKLRTWTLIFHRSIRSESSLTAEGSGAAVKIDLIR